MNSTKTRLLTTKQASEYTQISEYTLRERFKQGAIKTKRAGNHWRTTEQWLDEYLEAS
jgi:excisionase family DNA binding protein